MPNPLEWLGAFMPQDNLWEDPGKRAMYEQEQKLRKKKFDEEHPIRAAIGNAASSAMDFVGGLTGLGSSDSTSGKVGELVGAASDLIPEKAAVMKLAGLPLAWYKSAGKLKGLTRAQHAGYEMIDDAMVAGREAGNVYGKGIYAGGDPSIAKKFYEMYQQEGMPAVGKIREIDADAKNVLDLIDTKPEDIVKYVNTFPPELQQVHRQFFNDMIKKGHTSDEAYAALGKVLKNTPHGDAEALTKAGFDAVRYPYGGQDAWMFPLSTPVYKLEQGKRVPFNDAALRVRREEIAPKISVAPDNIQVPQGAILPSGRKISVKTETPKPNRIEIAPELAPVARTDEPVKKRMSLAELMATPSTKTAASTTTKSGKALSVADIKKLLNK